MMVMGIALMVCRNDDQFHRPGRTTYSHLTWLFERKVIHYSGIKQIERNARIFYTKNISLERVISHSKKERSIQFSLELNYCQ